MEAPENGIRFLEGLEKSGGRKSTFHDLGEFLEFKARQKWVPVSGQFELTPLCNLDCRMCYVHLVPEQLSGRSVLPVSAWKDLARQAAEEGLMMVSLTGGECLAYPGFDELFLYLQDLGCRIFVMTNGILLDDRRIRFFQEHRPADIQITLYGWNDDVYERVTGKRAFGTVFRNITRAMEAGLPLTVSVTPNAYLGEDVFETIRTGKALCGDLVVNAGLFPPRAETGRSEQKDDLDPDSYISIHRLLAELNGQVLRGIDPDQLPAPGGPSHECSTCGMKCGGGRSAFTIDWKGDLRACSHIEEIREHPLQDGFREAWKRINRKVKEWPRVPECEGCPYAKACNNCAAVISHYGAADKLPKELCEKTRYLVQHGVRHIPDCE